MNGQQELIPGTTRSRELSQWFSPPALAERVVEWAGVGCRGCACHSVYNGNMRFGAPCCPDCPPMRVLEPSAGNGALVRPLVAAGAWVTAIELDARYTQDLYDAGAQDRWPDMDFLRVSPNNGVALADFDLCVMNPPYEDGQDVAFILHALKFAPRVVGIFRSQIVHGKARKRELWSKVRPTRIAYLSERPDFGGEYGAMTDFVVLELVAIPPAERPGVQEIVSYARQEWW